MNVPPQDPVAPGEPEVSADPDATPTGTDSRTAVTPAPPVRSAAQQQAAERRRLLAEQIVAGMLPETTSDERPSGEGASGYSEQWYRENRPPHHG